MLTPGQVAHFETFGLLVSRQLFSPAEVDVISREFDAAMLEDRDGQPLDGQKHQSVREWFLGRPAAELLMYDERVHGPIEQLLGPGYSFLEWAENNANLYFGDTEWHPDQGWHPHIPEGRDDPNRFAEQWRNRYVPSVKVAFYLDPVGKETGCLRVIPGSHRSPFHEELWSLHADIPDSVSELESVRPKLLEMWEQATGDAESEERFLSDPKVNHFGLEPREVPSFPIESQPGDAVFFSHRMWHSSFGGAAGRRMFSLNFRRAQTKDGEGV